MRMRFPASVQLALCALKGASSLVDCGDDFICQWSGVHWWFLFHYYNHPPRLMSETRWFLCCRYPCGKFPAAKVRFWGGFVSGIINPFGVATFGMLSCWVVNFSRTSVKFRSVLLMSLPFTLFASQYLIPGSCLSWIGLRFRWLHWCRVLFIAVSGFWC